MFSYSHICICVWPYVLQYIHIYIYMYMYINAYIYSYIYIYIHIYIQVPAAHPPRCPGRSTNRSVYSLSDWAHLRVWRPRRSFCDRFWMLVLLGSILPTLGSPSQGRGPQRRLGGKSIRKSGSCVLRGSSPGIPFGPQIGTKSQKSRPEKHVIKHCAQSASQQISRDPKIVSNGYPFGTAVDGFGSRWVQLWRKTNRVTI